MPNEAPGGRRLGPPLGALALFAALSFAARIPYVQVPLSEDTGAYLYVGQAILDGDAPFADAADNKGPATYLLFALVKLLSGTSTVVVRLTMIAFAALACLAVAAYVWRTAGRTAALAAGALAAVLGSTPFLEGEDPNTEQYGVAPMAGAWWLAARGTPRSAAGAGALTGLATLLNPGFVVVAVVIALELWRAGPRRERVRRLVWATGAGLAVAVPFVLWLGAAGALDDLWIQVVGKAGSAVGGASGGDGAAFPSRPLLDVPARGLFVLGALGAAAAALRGELRDAGAAALLWIALMWLRVKLADYEFDHHYYPAVPGIAAGMALGATAIWRTGTAHGRLPRAIAPAAMGALLGLTVWLYVVEPGLEALGKPTAQRARFPQYALAYEVGDQLRRSTAPGDTVLVAGNHPTVYWRAGRRAPTRFFAEYALGEPAYEAERRRDLRAHPPDALVFMPGGSLFEADVRALAQRGYRRAWARSGASIWLRDRGPRS